MKFNKVGLVLGGGGAKGAYQIGVFKALYENSLSQDVSLVAGTSIGAINSILFADNNIEKSVKIWESLTKEKVLTKKKLLQYFDITNLKNISVYSRQGFLNLLDDNIDLEAISQSKMELYAVATPLKNNFGQTVFLLNNQTPDMIKDILLASSAIPGIFESVKINGVYYMDGYKVDNVPVSIAYENKCDLAYVIPLGKRNKIDPAKYPEMTIIDFKHPSYDNIPFNQGTLGFDINLIQERIELGYQCASLLIKYLREIGLLRVTRKEKFVNYVKDIFKRKKHRNYKNYYSLEDVGIYPKQDETPAIQGEDEIYDQND